jgi:hypothetical protein
VISHLARILFVLNSLQDGESDKSSKDVTARECEGCEARQRHSKNENEKKRGELLFFSFEPSRLVRPCQKRTPKVTGM